jgi:hypothetical protein
MPNNRTWRNRIESIRVGPLANVTAFTDEDFHGSGMPLEPGTSHPLLPEDVRARIESLRVSCLDK